MTLLHAPTAPPTVLGIGLYTLRDTGRLMHRPTATVRSWVAKGLAPSPVRLSSGQTTLLSFLDLVSLLVVRGLRGRGITLEQVRAAETYLRREWQLARPFAEKRIFTDGRSVLTALERGAKLSSIDREGQEVIPEVIHDDLVDVTYGANRLAAAWRPHDSVVLRPEIQFGAPCVEDTRITTASIYGLRAAGESVAALVDWFDLPEGSVTAAIAFEESIRRQH